MSSSTNLAFLAVLVVLALATLCVAAIQLSQRISLTPWEPAVAMEAVRVNAGLPAYELAHATHIYGPFLTVIWAGVLRIFGLNLLAVRVVISVLALTLAIFVSVLACSKLRTSGVIALLFLLGINFRTNLIFFSTQPDWIAALLAILALYLWTVRETSLVRSFVSIVLFLCATLFKQTTAVFAGIPFVHLLLWQRPTRVRDVVVSLLPAMSIAATFAFIRLFYLQMFIAMVTIPGSIKVYPERALNIMLYLFGTFPIFLVGLWSIWRSRSSITEGERWILSALVLVVPISIWTTCKSGSGFNSLLFAYLAMTALFVARFDAISEWLRSLPAQRSLFASVAIALTMLVSFFLQFDRAGALLSLRYGDDKYDGAVAIARRLDGVVVSPQDPTIPYRAKGYVGRSLFFELDAHAVNGNWPNEIPDSIGNELAQGSHVIVVHSFVPTPALEQALPQLGFRQVSFPELQNSAYTVWSKPSE